MSSQTNRMMLYCPRCSQELTARDIDGKTRYVCPNAQCGFIYWNNPVPVVAALVRYHDQYIIARNAAWPSNIFSVITGYLEQGESPEAAVLREVTEELGLTGKGTRLIGNYTFKEKNQVILSYEVEATGLIKTNHELAEIKLVSPEELARYDFSPLYITRMIIKDWHKGNF